MILTGARPQAGGIAGAGESLRGRRRYGGHTTDDRQNLLARRELVAAYVKVLDRRSELIELCSVDRDTAELRRALQDTFAITAVAADAILSLQVRRFAPSEMQKIRDEFADVYSQLELLDGS